MGINLAPPPIGLGEYLEFLENKGIATNVASFLGATTLRIHELGEADVAPNAEQLDRMRALVRQAERAMVRASDSHQVRGNTANLLSSSSEALQAWLEAIRKGAEWIVAKRLPEESAARLLEVLRSEGYYGGQIEVAMDNSVRPIRVTFRIELGPIYRLGAVSIEVEPPGVKGTT